jgi:hypothetical protein
MYNQYNPYGVNYGMQYGNQFQNQQAQSNLIKVNGIEGAKAYQMNANSSVALFDANNDIFYVKNTDGAGFPTIKAFSFTPLDVEQSNTEYVTRKEFEELKRMITDGKQFISTNDAE